MKEQSNMRKVTIVIVLLVISIAVLAVFAFLSAKKRSLTCTVSSLQEIDTKLIMKELQSKFHCDTGNLYVNVGDLHTVRVADSGTIAKDDFLQLTVLDITKEQKLRQKKVKQSILIKIRIRLRHIAE